MQKTFKSTFGLSLLTCAFMATGAAGQSGVNSDELISSLTRPAPLTRSLADAPPVLTAAERAFLLGLPTRGLTIEARAEVVEITEENELPRIDMDLPFDFDSFVLRADVIPNLVILGQALTSEGLAGNRFVIAGHTDASGSAEYNQALSIRRAEAVRQFLIDAFAIDGDRLVPIGFGFEQLARPDAPEADENRRVEIINLEVGLQ